MSLTCHLKIGTHPGCYSVEESYCSTSYHSNELENSARRINNMLECQLLYIETCKLGEHFKACKLDKDD
ncbi:hypothetical protein P8452_33593 [Trifolium repens]|nr:hypothetical protein P8452_33593 [Trifolium repens]